MVCVCVDKWYFAVKVLNVKGNAAPVILLLMAGWVGHRCVSVRVCEHVSAALHQVLEAAVVGIPHPKWGERPLLVVVPQPEHATGMCGMVLEAASAKVLKAAAAAAAMWCQGPACLVPAESIVGKDACANSGALQEAEGSSLLNTGLCLA
jgi:hypothetical protein